MAPYMSRMMRLLRRIGYLLLALVSCLSVTASAQQPAPQPQAQRVPVTPPVPTEVAKPALWKVQRGNTTIWLFGTIHMLPPGIDWFHGPVRDAFEGSQEFVTEIADTDPQEMQQLVAAHATLPQGQSLRGMLTPSLRAAYDKQLAQLQVSSQILDSYEPWYAAVSLSTMSLMRTGFNDQNGVEQVLDARAKQLGRPHGALETAAYQIGLFDSLPIESQKNYFSEVIEQLPTINDQLGQMVVAWRKGDADGLAKLLNTDEDDPMLLKTLLIDRNKNWAGWVKQRLGKPGSVFVAVGAGHLAGPASLQRQLAKQGIRVRRVQ